ncbi:uncharacterized protein A1O9_07475 [Exophiala aquamarina CBS 119918]|uniref:Molybdopterin dinucleotide-binding domain-containing protein n=1 Tax=Exophiala aquamarina CBS 119918 TaxID=1182545 RepID=A0A072PK58_9EURO|nr:uncharacterized protein A1O9_07475 [Exophiala aquamarina CBS 119918]KEF55895.1 hypothetical protein A1O9_07475 [Exophiala aquamarina CBS 119918]
MVEGQVFVPFHFGYFDAQDGKARAGNELTQDTKYPIDLFPLAPLCVVGEHPISKRPLFKSSSVRVTKVEKQDEGEVPHP